MNKYFDKDLNDWVVDIERKEKTIFDKLLVKDVSNKNIINWMINNIDELLIQHSGNTKAAYYSQSYKFLIFLCINGLCCDSLKIYKEKLISSNDKESTKKLAFISAMKLIKNTRRVDESLIEPNMYINLVETEGIAIERTYSPKSMSQDEYLNIKLAITSIENSASKMKFLMQLILMGEYGLRTNEVASLKINAFNFKSRELTFLKKGGTVRTITIRGELLNLAYEYISTLESKIYVFQKKYKVEPISQVRLSSVFNEMISQKGLEKIKLNKLRHFFATNIAIKTKGNIFEVQKKMGHKKIRSARYYVDIDRFNKEVVVD